MNAPLPLRTRWARRVYRRLLRIVPAEVRREFGADMTATFDALSADAGRRGRRPLCRLLGHELGDLIRVRRTTVAIGVRQIVERSISMRASLKQLARTSQWRQSLRALWRRPLFAATTIATLALGAGASTALFSIVDTVLIRPLPYPDADRLVTVFEASPSNRANQDRVSLIAPVRVDDWNRMNRTFVALSGSYAESMTDMSGPDPERLDGRRVLPGYFAVYGAPALLGRTFTSEEERFGGPGAVVVSEAWWTRHGRNPAIVDHSLVIGATPYRIVGVMPRAFSSGTIDVWLPAQLSPQLMHIRAARFISGIGRLKAGVSVLQAHDDLDRVQRELGVMYPQTDKDWSASVQDLKDARVGDRGLALWLLFGAVTLLWLIAVANVAGLVLVHVRRRRRELAIRMAIGASRAGVVGVILQEVGVVAAIGGGLGMGIAVWLIGLVPALFPALPRVAELGLDWRALTFAVASSVSAAIGCGLLPALQATRWRGSLGLAGSGRGVVGDGHRLQKLLVIGQVALSVTLCTAAALLVQSYYNLTHVDRGFSADGVMTFHIAARWDEDRTRVGQLQQQVIAELDRLPGVEAAGLTNFLPTGVGTLRFQIAVDGLTGPDPNGMMTVGQRTASAGYLRALRVPLAAGAWCPDLRLDVNAPRTAMVNQRFVDRFSQGAPIVGRQFHFEADPKSALTIVGVVGDVIEDGPNVATVPYVYACESAGAWPDPEYVVRAADPGAAIASLRGIVHRIDASRAVFGVRPLEEALDATVDAPRVNAGVISAFAATAMLLAALGLYGLFALLVSESRQEIGVRLALGATPRQIVRLVFAGAGRLVVAGVAAGLMLTAAGARLWEALLFGVGPRDGATWIGATLVLIAASAVAIAVPAVKASRVAPTDALRGE